VVEPHPAVAGDGEVGHGSRWSSTSSTIVGATRSRRRSLPPLHPLWRHQPRAITIHSPPPPRRLLVDNTHTSAPTALQGLAGAREREVVDIFDGMSEKEEEAHGHGRSFAILSGDGSNVDSCVGVPHQQKW
jgi:hypothetical protein